MTIEESRQQIINGISRIYEKTEADNIADLTLEHLTRFSPIERILRKDLPLSAAQEKLLFQIISRLQKHEPIQYVISEAWFAGFKVYVDNNVLVPRPETEELVDWVIKEVTSQMPIASGSTFKIIDVGTGSGCIAIALKRHLTDAEVWACDVSNEALNVARINADALRAAIDFIPIDFLDEDQRKQLPHVDIIVSNPPYVPESDKNEMRKNVLDFEPHLALFVPGNDALIFYDAIADFGKDKLNDGGKIYLEIHEGIG